MNVSLALRTFVADPIRRGRPDIARYRIAQLLHDRTNGRFDRIYRRIAPILWPKIPLPTSLLTVQEVADIAGHLKERGFLILPFSLSAEQVGEISNFAFSTPAYGRDMSAPVEIRRDAIPSEETRYNWWMQDIAKVPAIQKMLIDGPYAAIAQEYLGCRPTLAHVCLFLDRPMVGKFEPYEWHYDNEGPGFLKFFCFLTDIDIGTGAHHFIEGSHQPTKPPKFAKSAFYGNEALLAQYGAENERIARGRAGTILAEDTMGFHRGSPLDRGYRLLMQFEFSSIEIPTDEETRRPFHRVKVSNLSHGAAMVLKKFYVA
jgi:hypothetical protein